MTDYKMKGPEKSISSTIYQEDGKGLKDGLEVIGPRVLDGIAYVNIRTDLTLTFPEDVAETGPELSSVILGDWFNTPTGT